MTREGNASPKFGLPTKQCERHLSGIENRSGPGFVDWERMAMIKGISTNRNVADLAVALKASGIEFVGRYYGGSLSKRLSVSEAEALSAVGLRLMVFYQEFNNSVARFTPEAGTEQASRALDSARTIGQPQSSSIFFAVDFDPAQSELNGPVRSYFASVQAVFGAAGNPYQVGVYGSGLTCRFLSDQHLVSRTCLSDSAAFRGSAEFAQSGKWDVKQTLAHQPLLGLEPGVAGDYEFLEAHSSAGLFILGTQPAYRVFVGDQHREIECALVGGTAYLCARELFDCLFGVAQTDTDLELRDESLTWKGIALPGEVRILGGRAFVSIRPVAQFLGLDVEIEGRSIMLARPTTHSD